MATPLRRRIGALTVLGAGFVVGSLIAPVGNGHLASLVPANAEVPAATRDGHMNDSEQRAHAPTNILTSQPHAGDTVR